MRKVRDYDAELKALADRARALKAKRVQQLGELVIATGADAFEPEALAGLLLEAIGDKSAKEAWRVRGAAFFQRRGKKPEDGATGNDDGTDTDPGDNSPR